MPERTLCRIMFIAFCLLPTLFVGAWAVAVHSPAYAAARRLELEQQFARDTGVAVRLGSFRRDRDGAILVTSADILDASQTTLASIEGLRLEPKAKGWSGHAKKIALDRDHLAKLWETLDHRLLRSVNAEASQYRLTADRVEVTCRDPQNDQIAPTAVVESAEEIEQLQSLDVSLRTAGALRSCELRFSGVQFAGAPSAPLVELVIAQNIEKDVTHARLTATHADGVAARLFSRDLHALCGGACRLKGQIHVARNRDTWTTQVHGVQLQPVDLRRWSAAPSTLTGMARIDVEQARMTNGRLDLAAARVHAENGAINTVVMRELGKYLGLQPASHARDSDVQYSELSAKVWLQPHGVTVQGDCSAGGDIVILGNQGEPLLRSGPSEQTGRYMPAPVASVLHGLAQSSADPTALRRRAPTPMWVRDKRQGRVNTATRSAVSPK